jgi:hypothetical protein
MAGSRSSRRALLRAVDRSAAADKRRPLITYSAAADYAEKPCAALPPANRGRGSSHEGSLGGRGRCIRRARCVGGRSRASTIRSTASPSTHVSWCHRATLPAAAFDRAIHLCELRRSTGSRSKPPQFAKTSSATLRAKEGVRGGSSRLARARCDGRVRTPCERGANVRETPRVPARDSRLQTRHVQLSIYRDFLEAP